MSRRAWMVAGPAVVVTATALFVAAPARAESADASTCTGATEEECLARSSSCFWSEEPRGCNDATAPVDPNGGTGDPGGGGASAGADGCAVAFGAGSPPGALGFAVGAAMIAASVTRRRPRGGAAR